MHFQRVPQIRSNSAQRERGPARALSPLAGVRQRVYSLQPQLQVNQQQQQQQQQQPQPLLAGGNFQIAQQIPGSLPTLQYTVSSPQSSNLQTPNAKPGGGSAQQQQQQQILARQLVTPGKQGFLAPANQVSPPRSKNKIFLSPPQKIQPFFAHLQQQQQQQQQVLNRTATVIAQQRGTPQQIIYTDNSAQKRIQVPFQTSFAVNRNEQESGKRSSSNSPVQQTKLEKQNSPPRLIKQVIVKQPSPSLLPIRQQYTQQIFHNYQQLKKPQPAYSRLAEQLQSDNKKHSMSLLKSYNTHRKAPPIIEEGYISKQPSLTESNNSISMKNLQNNSPGTKNSGYERVEKLEGKVLLLMDDIEQLNKMVIMQIKETESWKDRCRELERENNQSSQQQISTELRMIQEEKELQEYQKQLEAVSKENGKLKFFLEQRTFEVDRLQEQLAIATQGNETIASLESDRTRLQKQIQLLQREEDVRIEFYEEKVQRLMSEIERLQQENSAKEQEIQHWKNLREQSSSTQKLDLEQLQQKLHEAERLATHYKKYEVRCQELEKQLVKVQIQRDSYLKEQQSQLKERVPLQQEQSEKMKQLEAENRQLKDSLAKETDLTLELKQQNLQLQAEKLLVISKQSSQSSIKQKEELHNLELNNLKIDAQRTRLQLESETKERQLLEKKYTQLQDQLRRQVLQRSTSQDSVNEPSTKAILQKEQEVDYWKNRYQMVEQLLRKYTQLDKTLRQFEE